MACLFPMALKIVVGEHLEEDPDAVDTIDEIDFVIQGLIRLGLDDDDVLDRCVLQMRLRLPMIWKVLRRGEY
jgi:hypothetical protein